MTIRRKKPGARGLVVVKDSGVAPLVRHGVREREGGPQPHAQPHHVKRRKPKHPKHPKQHKPKRGHRRGGGRRGGGGHHALTDKDVVAIVLAALQGGPLLLAVQDIVLQVFWELQAQQSARQNQPGSYQRLGGF